MEGRDYAATPGSIPAGTLAELFLETVELWRDGSAFRVFSNGSGELRDISYSEVFDQVKAAAFALGRSGVERGDRIAILSPNRPEWAVVDYACICAGVVDVPIYTSLTPSQIAYILEDSGAKIVFASDSELMAKVLEAREKVGHGLEVVVFDPPTAGDGDVGDPDSLPEGAHRWTAWLAEGASTTALTTDDHFREGALSVRPDDVTTLIYTSGTTGDPKGVMLTHGNVFANVHQAGEILEIGPDDVTLSFLPLSHVFQRMVDYLLFWRGCTIAYGRDILTVADDLKAVRPTLVVSVPRLYEKVYNRVMDATGVKGKLVRWARRTAVAWTDEKLAGREPNGWLRTSHRLADRIVFRKIREGVGGRLRFFVSGGAPLEPEINRFFYGAGVTILEGYGLTETSPVTNVNPVDKIKIGTVGPPVPGTEIRIAGDGEILIRGPQVMKGYYRAPEATALVIDSDGWFSTGDIGELDEDGYLRITDRKKDLIVTAGGKNVAPQPIENRLKTNSFVEQVVMVGDRRKFVALLVVPAFGLLEEWARAQGIQFGDRDALLDDARVRAKMADEVLGGLDDFASFERPKKVALLSREFSIEDGTLTPTQKVRRREVQARYDALIDRFYDEEHADISVLVDSDRGSPPNDDP